MSIEELENIAKDYEPKHDYDYINTNLAFKIFKNFISNKNVLEIGCADGSMTEKLVKYVSKLDVVEPCSRYCNIIQSNILNIHKVYNCFIEEFPKNKQYDVVICASLLHHIQEPIKFLNNLKKFIKPGGVLLATVPNVKSLHRRIGVKMGLLKDEYQDSERNIMFHQFGKYDKKKFITLFKQSEFTILECFGYMIKPFPSEIMEKISIDDDLLNAMFDIGKEFQDISSQLFIRAEL